MRYPDGARLDDMRARATSVIEAKRYTAEYPPIEELLAFYVIELLDEIEHLCRYNTELADELQEHNARYSRLAAKLHAVCNELHPKGLR